MFTIGFLKKNFQKVLIAVLVVVVGILGYKLFNSTAHNEELNNKIYTMETEHSMNVNSLQNELKISKQNAEEIKKVVEKIQADAKQPVTSYVVEKVESEPIVVTVEKQIEAKDSTLPPEVYENTDKTVVVEQPDNENYQVGVYKINTYRNWEFGIGAGVHNDDYYIPISLQRNYRKDKSIEFEIHYTPTKSEKINGGAIKFKTHF